MPCQPCPHHYDIWLARRFPHAASQHIHWVIILQKRGPGPSFLYHCINEKGHIPTDRYEMQIQPDDRCTSRSYQYRHFLGSTPETLLDEVSLQASRIPPQHCQYWAMYLILRLERRRILPRGTFDACSGAMTELWGDRGAGDIRH